MYQRDGQTYRYRLAAQPIDEGLVVSWHDTLVDLDDMGAGLSGDVLTARQVRMLGQIADGRSTTEIAAALHLSPFTVRNEIRRILAELGVRTRAEAVGVALGRRLISSARTEGSAEEW